jgi:hypothetical protein
VSDHDGVESAFGRRSVDADRQSRSGDIVVLRTPDGLRFQLVKGTPEGEETDVLAAALDRVVAWDKSQELGPWVTGIRPGIGLRSTWGQEP